MQDMRANPDELLKAIQQEEVKVKQGKLKIFFGFAAGVGKTYAMLQAAQAATERGIDVVVGYVEPHSRPATAALLDGLETIPNKKVVYNNITLKEFDLDAAIKRRPQLILVDELAHTNAPGCRHSKRYQDVEELLKAGINVYTTINVQHIESLNDMVASITGVLVRERIPDHVFDDASQIELVDIEPLELIERLNAGEIYQETQAQKALSNFFSVENLVALREIALRRCADKVNKISENARIKSNSDYFTDEHILVCLSPSPSNGKIIRTAARMAHAFKGCFTAFFVETPEFANISEEDKVRLRSNIRLAEQLGATIETVYGEDIAFQIAEFARLSGVSKIVAGRNNIQRKHIFSKPSLTEKLINYSPNLDIYIIPDKDTSIYRAKQSMHMPNKFLVADIIKSILILVISTIIGSIFYELGFSEANIITIYILGVLITAITTSQRAYSLISSVISVLVFNFFFTEPRFTLNAYGSGYPATFLITLIAAFITGTLAVKIKQHAKQAAKIGFRTKVLFDTNQLLQKAKIREEIINVAANQLTKLLNKDIVFYGTSNGNLEPPKVFSLPDHETRQDIISENEQAVAAWVMKNNKHAGAGTNTLANAKCQYLAVRINDHVYGVIGIVMEDTLLDAFENSILLSILGECALALENERAAQEKEEAAILGKNEQLRANLLRSISHDLRTPLTSISGNAGILLANEEALDKAKRKQIYTDIQDDSLWLINLVENILSITRIEDGTMHLNLTAELIDEVITEALRHVNRQQAKHEIIFNQSEEFILGKMDARLIMQVIINLVDNAIKHTPSNSTITINTYKQNNMVVVEVSDNGSGISEDDKKQIFDMFYTVSGNIVDSHRSLGLGLALCKSIINAHGGEITVKDNLPKGTSFLFTIPAGEVQIHE